MRPIDKETAQLTYPPREAARKARRLDEKAADLPDAGRPDAPDDLNERELNVWNSVADVLERRGSLTPGDGAIITLLSGATVALQFEKKQMEREGGRVVVATHVDRHGAAIARHEINPRFRVIRQLEEQIVTCLKELGLTPLRRKLVGKTRGAGSLNLDDLLNFSTRPS